MTKALIIIAIAELIGVTVTTFNTVMWLYFSKKEDKRRDAQDRVVELLQKEKPNRPSSNECVRCIYTDNLCVPSDYDKDKYNYCDHFKSVFEENEELKAQIEKLKSCSNCIHYSSTFGLCHYSMGDEDYDCRGRKWEIKEDDE